MSDLDPRELVSAFIDGELAGEELRAFEAAVLADTDLAEEVDALRALVSELGDLPAIPVPRSVSESVLARVADLPIPRAEVAAAAEQAAVSEDSIGLITETGVAADIPKLALSAIAGPGGLSGMLDALLGSLWLKVPAGAAIAVLLGLGMSHLISPERVVPPMAQFAASESSSQDVPLVGGTYGDDGLADLSEEQIRPHRETSPPDAADFNDEGSASLMQRPASRVRSGSAAAPTARRREKRKKTPESVVGPDGVYEAEWEAQAEAEWEAQAEAELADVKEDEVGQEEDGVVSEERAPAPTGGDFDEEEKAEDKSVSEGAPSAGFARTSGRAAFGKAADVTMAGEPLEDHLEPDADNELLTLKPTAEPSMPAASAEKRSELSRSAPPGPRTGNLLKVQTRAAANRLVQGLVAVPAYDLQVTRHPTYFVLTLRVPSSDWETAVATLRSAGALDLSGGATVSGQQQRIALDVLW
jgi:hypothetical protein